MELAVDFSYLKKYGNSRHYKIPTCLEKYKYKVGQPLYNARITHIYDLSKFWLTTKPKELQLFETYLNEIYKEISMQYKMPVRQVTLNDYCMVLWEDKYRRGIIVGFPITYSTCQQVNVFCFDYGFNIIIDIDQLFYIKEECMEVPRFTIRAALLLAPITDNWTAKAVAKFKDLSVNRSVHCQIMIVDDALHTLWVHIYDIQEALTAEKMGQPVLTKANMMTSAQTDRELRVSYGFLFPRHDVIERGLVPGGIEAAEFLEKLLPNVQTQEFLYIGNIPANNSNNRIRRELRPISGGLVDVISLKLPRSKSKNCGFCFLEYESFSAASAAKLHISRAKIWNDRKLVVEWLLDSHAKIIYLENMSKEVTEKKLMDVVTVFGSIAFLRKFATCAFLHFFESEAAVKAMEEVNWRLYFGASVRVLLKKYYDLFNGFQDLACRKCTAEGPLADVNWRQLKCY